MKVAMVTPFPPSDSKHIQTTGVASYSKNLIDSLSTYCDVVVVSENIQGAAEEHIGNISVIPTWDKGKDYPFTIYKTVRKENVDVIHIQHETFIFGSMFSALEFPLLLLMLRRLGRPIVVTMHGVLPLSRIDRQFLADNRIKGRPWFLRIGTLINTKMIVALSDKVIVHEEVLKQSLIEEYGCQERKIAVIGHGIETVKNVPDQGEAKKRIGLEGKRIILFLGYITGYKNIELVIRSMEFIRDKDAVLIIAGGEHPRMKEDPKYQEYLKGLRDTANSIAPSRIIFKGFLPEGELPEYMAAADALVFPYNICMSTSGPLAIAVAYRKPFLVSRCFDKVVPLEEAKFDNDPKELAQKLDQLFVDDGGVNQRIMNYIDTVVSEKSWGRIAEKIHSIYRDEV